MALPKNWWILLIPVAVIAYEFFSKKSEPTVAKGKEEYYLAFNRDEVMKDLVQAEAHLRNVQKRKEKSGTADAEQHMRSEGFLNCVVKHSINAEGNMDEGISHSLVVEGSDTSGKWRMLRNDTRKFRHNLQAGILSVDEAILGIRRIRRKFESFNPDFDISKCEACSIKPVLVT